jgi:hypothetical protein
MRWYPAIHLPQAPSGAFPRSGSGPPLTAGDAILPSPLSPVHRGSRGSALASGERGLKPNRDNARERGSGKLCPRQLGERDDSL